MRATTLIVILALLGGVGYLVIFKRGAVSKTLGGYSKANTPQEAADLFKKAIEAREYTIAAGYCTKEYGEQLTRGASAATDLAVAIDNLQYQLKERGLERDETKLALFLLDPFPKNITILVSKESGANADATLTFALPPGGNSQASAGKWALKPEMFQAFTRSMVYTAPTTVKVKLANDPTLGWQFDFPADPALQVRVAYLNDKAKNYVNAMKVITQDVKTDPTTKEDLTNQLKIKLESAARE